MNIYYKIKIINNKTLKKNNQLYDYNYYLFFNCLSLSLLICLKFLSILLLFHIFFTSIRNLQLCILYLLNFFYTNKHIEEMKTNDFEKENIK